jgi:septum formation protein
LLRDLGVPFTVVASEADESLSGGPAERLAEANALAKVRGAVLPDGTEPGSFVLGTDTLVASGERVMGKPGTAEEAAGMLAALSGRTHQVVSGVALGRVALDGSLARPEQVRVAHAVTDVTFAVLDEAQIRAYLASGEWKGKAGAYGVQGIAGLWVSGLRGEYSNVVGLPLHLLACMFRDGGFDLVRGEWLEAGRTRRVGTAAAQ